MLSSATLSVVGREDDPRFPPHGCTTVVHAPIAQMDRALASGAKGQRFESSWARHLSVMYISK